MCLQIYDAIKLLGENKMYREALGLAKARLDENDDVLAATIKNWANKLKNGSALTFYFLLFHIQ